MVVSSSGGREAREALGGRAAGGEGELRGGVGCGGSGGERGAGGGGGGGGARKAAAAAAAVQDPHNNGARAALTNEIRSEFFRLYGECARSFTDFLDPFGSVSPCLCPVSVSLSLSRHCLLFSVPVPYLCCSSFLRTLFFLSHSSLVLFLLCGRKKEAGNQKNYPYRFIIVFFVAVSGSGCLFACLLAWGKYPGAPKRLAVARTLRNSAIVS